MTRALLIAFEGRDEAGNLIEKRDENNPYLVLVGIGEVIPGLEEVLKTMKEGEEKEVKIPPEKGFGKRDPEKIVIIPEREFKKRGITPYPGLVIEADGKRGRVIAVSGGRVQVDFNHELAGKTLVYKVKVVKEVKELEDVVRLLFKKFAGVEPEKVLVEKGTVRISYEYQKGIEQAELPFLVSLLTAYPEIKEVRLERIFRRKERGGKKEARK